MSRFISINSFLFKMEGVITEIDLKTSNILIL